MGKHYKLTGYVDWNGGGFGVWSFNSIPYIGYLDAKGMFLISTVIKNDDRIKNKLLAFTLMILLRSKHTYK